MFQQLWTTVLIKLMMFYRKSTFIKFCKVIIASHMPRSNCRNWETQGYFLIPCVLAFTDTISIYLHLCATGWIAMWNLIYPARWYCCAQIVTPRDATKTKETVLQLARLYCQHNRNYFRTHLQHPIAAM